MWLPPLFSVKKGILDFLRLVIMFHHSSSSKNKLWRVPGVYGAFQEPEFKMVHPSVGGENKTDTRLHNGAAQIKSFITLQFGASILDC